MKRDLRQHMESCHNQSGAKPACTICHKEFKLAKCLKSHMKTHENERITYPCNSCTKEYFSKISLDLHTKKYHIKNADK